MTPIRSLATILCCGALVACDANSDSLGTVQQDPGTSDATGGTDPIGSESGSTETGAIGTGDGTGLALCRGLSNDEPYLNIVTAFPEETGAFDIVVDRGGGERCLSGAGVDGPWVDDDADEHPKNKAGALRIGSITAVQAVRGEPFRVELVDADTGETAYTTLTYQLDVVGMHLLIIRGEPEDEELVSRTSPPDAGTDDIIILNGIAGGAPEILAWSGDDPPQSVHDGVPYGEYAVFNNVPFETAPAPSGPFEHLMFEGDPEYYAPGEMPRFAGPQSDSYRVCSPGDSNTMLLFRVNHVGAAAAVRCWL